jgi:hypothetical protein
MDVPGWDITGRASGLRLCGRNEEGDLSMRFVEVAGIKLKSDSFRQ